MSNKPQIARCPYCRAPLSAAARDFARNRFLPFCSERCKMADLGTWFSEGYGVRQSFDELTPEQIDDLPEPEDR